MIATAAVDLRPLVDRLEALATRRLASVPRSEAALARARRLADHVRGHVRVRAASLDAPLVVVLLGPTGAGKSTLFNTIAGRAASQTGVLRPTTRAAVVLLHPADREALAAGALAGIEPALLRFVEVPSIEPGLALVDAPDIDSIEHANRDLADRLAEAADLCLFVTTATRYADRVPWDVLARVRERRLPMLVVVNRMPPDASDRAEVVRDLRRLLVEHDLGPVLERPDGDDAIVSVPEGALATGGEALAAGSVPAVLGEVARLRSAREERRALAARALAGSLAGLGDALDAIADDAQHESIDVEALRRTADRTYESHLVALRQELDQGAFLREEALRHWQAFVGADQITRFFSEGIGRVRGALSALFRPATAPVAELRAATTDDLMAVARLEAAEAARRTASAWSADPAMGQAVSAAADLWLPSPDFDERLRNRLQAWMDGIAEDIQAHGRSKRSVARGASLGVNAVGTGVMLATFLHTGGLTGAEVGVAAATAFLNQKLLSALFGEAAMVELVSGARTRLGEALATTFDEERARFDALLAPSGELDSLSAELRQAARDVRALRAAA